MTLNELAQHIHQGNVERGFWSDALITASLIDRPDTMKSVKKAYQSQRLMLVVSELSEALEALRKDLQDDKLPEHSGFDVEVVDAIIRLFDIGAGYGIDLDTILEKKLAVNASRGYKHGGKAF